jgi:hypothetical protein
MKLFAQEKGIISGEINLCADSIVLHHATAAPFKNRNATPAIES